MLLIMKRILTLLVLTTLCSAFSARADEARLLRFPATNGTEVAFSYAGDLWTVPVQGGVAKRLTSHIGYEMFARYSPDGKSIAFTGEYDGNREVYLIPSAGGEPVRLTYTATNGRDDLGDRIASTRPREHRGVSVESFVKLERWDREWKGRDFEKSPQEVALVISLVGCRGHSK